MAAGPGGKDGAAVIASRPSTASRAVVMNAANSPGTVSTYPRAPDDLESVEARGQHLRQGRRVSQTGFYQLRVLHISTVLAVGRRPGVPRLVAGCSGGGMAGQADDFCDLAQVIIGQMVAMAT